MSERMFHLMATRRLTSTLGVLSISIAGFATLAVFQGLLPYILTSATDRSLIVDFSLLLACTQVGQAVGLQTHIGDTSYQAHVHWEPLAAVALLGMIAVATQPVLSSAPISNMIAIGASGLSAGLLIGRLAAETVTPFKRDVFPKAVLMRNVLWAALGLGMVAIAPDRYALQATLFALVVATVAGVGFLYMVGNIYHSSLDWKQHTRYRSKAAHVLRHYRVQLPTVIFGLGCTLIYRNDVTFARAALPEGVNLAVGNLALVGYSAVAGMAGMLGLHVVTPIWRGDSTRKRRAARPLTILALMGFLVASLIVLPPLDGATTALLAAALLVPAIPSSIVTFQSLWLHIEGASAAVYLVGAGTVALMPLIAQWRPLGALGAASAMQLACLTTTIGLVAHTRNRRELVRS
jgi:hypothetical protein